MLKHCISKLQKVQLKLSILMKKKIQSLSTKQAQLSKLAAVMSTSCAQLHQGEATNITLNGIQTLTRNQKVNVQGHLTLGQNPNKEVIKRNGEKGYVKEDCVIEDRTGSATMHIWDNLLTQLESGNTYSFQNLSVKNYSGMTLLGTTATTTFQKADL